MDKLLKVGGINVLATGKQVTPQGRSESSVVKVESLVVGHNRATELKVKVLLVTLNDTAGTDAHLVCKTLLHIRKDSIDELLLVLTANGLRHGTHSYKKHPHMQGGDLEPLRESGWQLQVVVVELGSGRHRRLHLLFRQFTLGVCHKKTLLLRHLIVERARNRTGSDTIHIKRECVDNLLTQQTLPRGEVTGVLLVLLNGGGYDSLSVTQVRLLDLVKQTTGLRCKRRALL